ncbi:GDSL esterase lipase At1g54790-like [Olea europaea subsp. europaea]|uniref:GDSL esterase lipase At1g54790-like n=1 Tax=Olea europaea subsp. europaea TaxID=158383 RepID=A0A8S0Q107_OLEEU|nr:GDSL esterase lipase At1g54790-like [Olea europaea subsp. europaea]
MFDIGRNDLAGSFYSKTFNQILALIPSILSEFQDSIKTFFPLEELDEEEDEEDEVEATLLREPAIILESNHI